MYSALNPGVIGVTAPNLDATIAAARFAGFQGVEVNGAEIAELGPERAKERLSQSLPANTPSLQSSIPPPPILQPSNPPILPAAFGLPLDWRGDQRALTDALPNLAKIAQACAEIGCTRTFTWIMPCSDEREFAENRRFHIDRLSQVANVLADNGCSFGLEFIGPKTLRDSQRYPFIYQMAPMLEMAREIGPNVGLMLDCWHWYTSGGTVADIEKLAASDVVAAHVSDAPLGIDRDVQVDSIRSVPASTGVIDSRGFMRALQKIGYNGPVIPEPFGSELSDLASDEERVRVVAEGMRKLFSYLD